MMVDNNPDSVYSTQEQLDFARKMAESLLKGGGYSGPPADMAVLPGTWMYGVPNIIKAISGAQYRDLAGGQESKLVDRQSGQPGLTPPVNRYGARVSQPNPNNAPVPGGPGPVAKNTPSGPEANPVASNIPGQGQDKGKMLFDYFVSKGWSPQVAAGIVSNFWHESKFDEKATGDGNRSIGVGQWQGARRNALSMFANKPADQTSIMEQAAFTHHELTEGGEKAVGDMLKKVNDPNIAGQIVSSYYERPYRNEAKARGATAGDMFTKYGGANPVASANSPSVNVPGTTLDNTSRMNLGGPPIPGQTPNPTMPSGPQMAQGPQMAPGGPQMEQAAPNISQPTTNPQMSPAIGQPGIGIPPPRPNLTPDQLNATLRLAPPDQRSGIMQDYMKRNEREDIENLYGKYGITPQGPGQQPIVTNIGPQKAIPFQVGPLHFQMIPKQGGDAEIILPNGKIGSVNDMWNYVQDMEAQGHEKTARAGAQAARYEADQQHAEANYRPTRDRGDQLTMAAEIANDPTFISGTAQQRRELISKFFHSVGMQPPGEGADITQAFVKLISGNILEDIKGLGGQGLGQVRAKEMEIIEKMNAMPDMDPGAVRAVVNLTKKMNERTQEFQDKLLDYSASHHGQIDAGFYQEMRKYYNKHHFLSEDEIRNYKEMFKPRAKEVPWEEAPLGAKRRKIE